MNTDKLNKWLTLVANLGVIAGIVFLAIEVSQNNRMMRSQTRSDIAHALSQQFWDFANSDLVSIFDQEKSIEDYSGDEQARVGAVVSSYLRIWENIHYQYRNGMYEESEFSREREAWRFNANYPLTKSVFCAARSVYAQAFVSEFESLMQTPC